jgi:hypothetical protein
VFRVIPNSLRDAINEKLDNAFAGMDVKAEDRESVYNQLLNYFDEHGYIPEFEITKKGKVKE